MSSERRASRPSDVAHPSRATAALTIGVIALIAAFLYLVRNALIPFVFAGVIAFVTMPAIDWAAARTRLPRWIFTLITLLLLLGFFALIGWLGVPSLFQQIARVGSNLQGSIAEIVAQFVGNGPINLFGKQMNAQSIAENVIGFAGAFMSAHAFSRRFQQKRRLECNPCFSTTRRLSGPPRRLLPLPAHGSNRRVRPRPRAASAARHLRILGRSALHVSRPAHQGGPRSRLERRHACVARRPVLNLHLWNEHVPPMGATTVSFNWAREFTQRVDLSMRALARHLRWNRLLDDVVAVRGDIRLRTAAQSGPLARLAGRYGFEPGGTDDFDFGSEPCNGLAENVFICLLVLGNQPGRVARPCAAPPPQTRISLACPPRNALCSGRAASG